LLCLRLILFHCPKKVQNILTKLGSAAQSTFIQCLYVHQNDLLNTYFIHVYGYIFYICLWLHILYMSMVTYFVYAYNYLLYICLWSPTLYMSMITFFTYVYCYLYYIYVVTFFICLWLNSLYVCGYLLHMSVVTCFTYVYCDLF
jgi:hypothetical protein